MKFRLLLLVLAIAALVVLSSAPALANDYGCTPGYWKNHTDSWVVYTPDQRVIDVLDLPSLTLFDGSSLPASTTLLQALQGGGGSGFQGAAKIYLRAAVAKLLNITAGFHPGEPDGATFKTYMVSGITSFTRTKLISDASLFDSDNNAPMGCPLN